MAGIKEPPAKRIKLSSFKPNIPKNNATNRFISKITSKQNKSVNGVVQNGKKINGFKQEQEDLPIRKVGDDLLKKLSEKDTNILIGDTGSGKTTQVPQLIYKSGLLGQGCMVVTQPRRIAAKSVSARVADEINCELGKLVGYSVRFEDMTSAETKIKFATDGMLLREAMLDFLLKKYTWIVLDEAHERTVNNDILFGVVKRAQRIRRKRNLPTLHILVMSATVNADKFSTYFKNCPVLSVEGREHDLKIFFTPSMPDDYVLACLRTVLKIHQEVPIDHGILVFLTGQLEIDRACTTLNRVLTKLKDKDFPPMDVHALYAALPETKQSEIFQPSQAGRRRVIISTNLCETSVTIPGIRVVVDSGKSKVRTFNPKSGLDVLKVEPISQAEAWQRAGRAGREADGICYHAYTEKHFEKMTMMPLPEISRTSLSSVILQLLTVGVKDVLTFDFIDKPNKSYLERAVEDLILLEAVKKLDDGKLELTEEGKKMAVFPLDPHLSKIILSGPKYHCTHEVLTIIAMLDSEQAFITPTATKAKAAARARHSQFAHSSGDHITLLKVFQMFKKSKKNKTWCYENFLNYRNLTYASNTRQQLSQICMRNNIDLLSCGDRHDEVLKCMVTGLFTNVAERQPDKKFRTLRDREEVKVHPSSVLHFVAGGYLLYSQLINTGNRNCMHTVSSVSPSWLYDIKREYFRSRHIRADPSSCDPQIIKMRQKQRAAAAASNGDN